MAGVTIKNGIQRKKLESLKSELEYLNSHTVKVGWVDPTEMHKPANPKEQPRSMAMVARTLNYGREAGTTSNGKRYPAIPARPFMDLTFRKNRRKLEETVNGLYSMLANGKTTGKKLVTIAAEFWMGKIRDTMDNSAQFIALSPATIAARKRRNRSLRSISADKPLIDTGALKESIDFEVTPR